jgi:putative hemolysin
MYSQSAGIEAKVRPSYAVSLAQSSDLNAIFRLRYDIFYREMGAVDDMAAAHGLDVDEYDSLCDHIVVSQGSKIVGTYRLLPLARLGHTFSENALGMDSERPENPYSQSEFDVTAIREVYTDEKILELGRSCIHPDHRNGQAARVLWSGVAKYMVQHGFQALIGCVSIHDISELQALRLAATFKEKGMWDERFDLGVQPKYQSEFDASEVDLDSLGVMPADATRMLPPLMKGYVNLGAKVCGGPAFDKNFACHDFLMLLDVSKLSPRHLAALTR